MDLVFPRVCAIVRYKLSKLVCCEKSTLLPNYHPHFNFFYISFTINSNLIVSLTVFPKLWLRDIIF